MIKQLLSFRIPSFIGIILLLIGVGVTSYLVDQGIIFESRAAPDNTPANLAITNVTPTSFTVMYTTQEKVTGSLSYGTEKTTSNVAMDDRDKQLGRSSEVTAHHITVNNLTPNTTYYFKILSGSSTFQNQEEPYTVKTAPQLSVSPPDLEAVSGSVRFMEGITDTDLLVLLTPPNSQPLSGIVTADGEYTLPIASVRKSDLSSYASLTNTSLLKVVILSHTKSSQISSTLENARPIPLALFGQSYDFTVSADPLPTSTASNSASTQFPVSSESSGNSQQVAILSPENNETFSDLQPKFTGTGLPGETIEITIHSGEPITATVPVSSTGTWEFRPTQPLSSGSHTITIKTRDVSGTLREFSRSFTVNAQGSQFIEPSISPTRTPTPTLISLTETPTPTPTVPQPTVTEAPTAAPTAVITEGPSPTRGPIPPAGSESVVIGGILGVGTVIVGFILFFLTKGSTL